MLSHTRMGVPYEYTHMGRPIRVWANIRIWVGMSLFCFFLTYFSFRQFFYFQPIFLNILPEIYVFCSMIINMYIATCS